jgi:hypothetical protein
MLVIVQTQHNMGITAATVNELLQQQGPWEQQQQPPWHTACLCSAGKVGSWCHAMATVAQLSGFADGPRDERFIIRSTTLRRTPEGTVPPINR